MNNTKWCNGLYIHFRQSFAKETFSYGEYLKNYENKYWKPKVRERKKTAVHGTLQMILLAWKLHSKQLLCKTLNSSINIIETRAVLNIVKKDVKYALEAKLENLEIILKFLILGQNKTQCSRVPCHYELVKYYLISERIVKICKSHKLTYNR